MMARRRLVPAVVAVLIACLAQPGAAKADPPAVGHYDTGFGPIKLFQDVSGVFIGIYTYKGLPAHIYLTLGERGFYDAIWVQGTSEVRCGKKKTGSPFWGRARFAFKDGGMLGVWNYCDRAYTKDKRFRWKGTLRR